MNNMCNVKTFKSNKNISGGWKFGRIRTNIWGGDGEKGTFTSYFIPVYDI